MARINGYTVPDAMVPVFKKATPEQQAQMMSDIKTRADRYDNNSWFGNLTDNSGITKPIDPYQQSDALSQYYAKLQQLLDDPGQVGMTAQEQADYMNSARRVGEDTMYSAGAGYDRWAASRGITGGPVADAKLKLAQELMRNMTSAKLNMNDMNFRARTNARLAALGAMGGAVGQIEQGNQLNYQQQLMDQMAQEQMLSQLIGQGMYAYFQGGLPSGMPMTVPQAVPGYNPAVMSSPRGIYG